MDQRLHIFLPFLLAAFALGCDDRASSIASKSPPPPPPATVAHPGTIWGRVIFAGPAPKLPRLPTTGDPTCHQMHPDGVPDESILIGPGGGLANVFVYIKDAPASTGSARPPALIDQINCQYVPHALAVQVDQPLRVKSSDMVLHNVHVMADKNPSLNLAEIQPGEQTIRFAQPEFLHFRCDVHPWMKAVVGVFNSPYFATTGPDGTYKITGVPPGSHTLAIWHERFGEMQRNVKVEADGRVREEFVYKP
ncbi:MAG TPA: carboxypeptidase regulatory-like domain-containing protein [Tepidisphaeraceae bacterium]|nr:carboxypeptidase regulatory-like domain-containing protein [Tepidisphaeraceae bacterium]